MFFGHKVERLTCLQYSLVSLIPDSLRNLKSVSDSNLEFPNESEVNSIKRKNLYNLPLQIFGLGYVWLPYVTLQQMDVLLSPDTKGFIVGTSNAIFTQHSLCNIDVVVNIDNGSVEIRDPALASLLALTSPDKVFIEEIVKCVASSWDESETEDLLYQHMGFEGSDDDIRARFENYLVSMLASVLVMDETKVSKETIASGDSKPKCLIVLI